MILKMKFNQYSQLQVNQSFIVSKNQKEKKILISFLILSILKKKKLNKFRFKWIRFRKILENKEKILLIKIINDIIINLLKYFITQRFGFLLLMRTFLIYHFHVFFILHFQLIIKYMWIQHIYIIYFYTS